MRDYSISQIFPQISAKLIYFSLCFSFLPLSLFPLPFLSFVYHKYVIPRRHKSPFPQILTRVYGQARLHYAKSFILYIGAFALVLIAILYSLKYLAADRYLHLPRQPPCLFLIFPRFPTLINTARFIRGSDTWRGKTVRFRTSETTYVFYP